MKRSRAFSRSARPPAPIAVKKKPTPAPTPAPKPSAPVVRKKVLAADLGLLCDAVKAYSWPELQAVKGDRPTLDKLREALSLLDHLRQRLDTRDD